MGKKEVSRGLGPDIYLDSAVLQCHLLLVVMRACMHSSSNTPASPCCLQALLPD